MPNVDNYGFGGVGGIGGLGGMGPVSPPPSAELTWINGQVVFAVVWFGFWQNIAQTRKMIPVIV
jgi:hypothetical protein